MYVPLSSQGPDEWPEQTHEPIAAHSLRMGQFALMVKRDGSSSSSSSRLRRPEGGGDDDESRETTTMTTTTTITTTTTTTTNGQCREDDPPEEGVGGNHRQPPQRGKPWPCRMDDGWCPPSCSIPNFGKGTMHSCSDKICRWNCLGLQGSLLMSVLDGPIYMTTLTVGRKFSREVCRRAVCCRADGFGSRKWRKSSNDDDDDDNADDLGNYKLNHPTLMETNVYMDEEGELEPRASPYYAEQIFFVI